MNNILISKIKKVSKIIHVADIHIRNLRRHDEYIEQFNKFYEKIKQIVDNETIIYVGGDIVHTKTDMSPELISMVSDFFINLSSLAPTIVITGNHDANLNNLDRLDALTPIIDNIKNDNLFYLRDTGLYQFNNVMFSVMSIFDDKEKYIKAAEIPSEYIKIALFHGPVANSTTNSDYDIHSTFTDSMFIGYDYGLLGDIHQYQYITPTVAYPSSLIQQNYGESVNNHGFILWDLNTKTSKYYHLNNDYAFHTLEIVNSVLCDYENMQHITSKSRVRVKVTNTTDDKLNEILSNIKRKCKISDIVIVRNDLLQADNTLNSLQITNIDVRDVTTQNKLIYDYLNLNLNLSLDEDILSRIYNINSTTNTKIVNKLDNKNLIWKPKRFEFSNMFSYGEDNVVDFTSLSGIYGLLGTNAIGKSSLLDSLLFCLFDTTSRAFKADHILNTKSDSFHCKFNFEINGVDYFIEKFGTKRINSDGAYKVKVDINFWSEHNGIIKNLNGDQRRNTNSIIQSYIGTYEDFTLMELLIQNNNTNFVDKSQTERKEILSNFLDLNIFDNLYTIANSEYKAIVSDIDEYNLVELQDLISDSKKLIDVYNAQYLEIKDKSNKITEEINNINSSILDETKKLKDITSIDIQFYTDEKNRLENLLKDKHLKLQELNALIRQHKINADIILSNMSKFDKLSLESKNAEYKLKEKELADLNFKIKTLNVSIEHQENQLNKLQEHKYDPNCQFCINNVFVKDAIKTKDNIILDKNKLEKLTTKYNEVDQYLFNNRNIVNNLRELSELSDSLNGVNNSINLLTIETLSIKNVIDTSNTRLSECISKINDYELNSIAIQENDKISTNISKLNDSLVKLQNEYNKIKNSELETFSNIKVTEERLSVSEEKYVTLNELIRKKAAYEYYLLCIDKDGISYYLISKILPKIENEINNILSDLVDFKIILNMDGKNVNSFIVYDDKYWPLECSSGMERFISSIAIRIALIRIASLPKTKFFVIDEGFGVLDPYNLNQIYLLFNYMRDAFDFTLIVSHLEIIKDMVDTIINIQNDNGFSKLTV